MTGQTLLVSLLVLAGCGDPPPSEYPAQRVHVEDTTLGVGDAFEVRVFRQDDLTSKYEVSSDGTISFPMIGTVAVVGKTPVAVEREIRDRLADGYLKNPQVSVLVLARKSKRITVFGQIKTSGTLAFSEGMTVVDAIAQAGGFTQMARKNAVRVTRTVGDEKKEYIIPVERIGQGKAQNFFVRPGDVVFVPRRVW